MRILDRALSSKKPRSVQSDWRACLPELKNEIYERCVQDLESAYIIWSISLNETIGLHREGRLVQAAQSVCVTASLCSRLTASLESLFRGIAAFARHYGMVPNTLPLDTANFKSEKGQRGAKMSALVSHVLLTQRSRFIHKINTLLAVVTDLGHHYRTAAEDLVCGTSVEPAVAWRVIDDVHYDLNTCLREAIVLFKSFLIALPDEQLSAFADMRAAYLKASAPQQAPALGRYVRGGRMAPISGE